MPKAVTIGGALLVLGLTAPAAEAQRLDSASIQNAKRSWGFTSTRVDSRTAHFIYTGYGYRDAFVLGAILFNPRTDYSETLVGLGFRRRPDSTSSHFAVAGLARATEGEYVQLYYLPTVFAASIRVEATLEVYLPLSRAGAVQYYVTPLAFVRGIAGPIAGGLTYELALLPGTTDAHLVGPTLRLTLPGGEAGVDAFAGIRRAAGKVRFSYRAFY